jgi:hypothetical protein
MSLRIAPKSSPGSWAAVAASNRDPKLVAKIEQETTLINAEKEAKKRSLARQEYLEREARRQEKKRRSELAAKAKEIAHVEDMVEKWGQHRWFRMVDGTNDDCQIAEELRWKEDQEQFDLYYEMRQKEKKWAQEFKAKEKEKEKLRQEAKTTMTCEEFAEFEHQEWLDEMDEEEAYMNNGSREWYHLERLRQADATRLTKWEQKQKK